MTPTGDDFLRRAAVAGQFYPADPQTLRQQTTEFLAAAESTARAAIAVIVPHAGYVYSGHVAGVTFAGVEVPRRVIVLAVNHRTRAAPLASWAYGSWQTPLGDVPVDVDMVASIAQNLPSLVHDPRAHHGEHSLEVELPFLLVRQPELQIAPISISSHNSDELVALGHAIAVAIDAVNEPVLIVASTDFTHYQTADFARREDAYAIARILDVDGVGLLDVVRTRAISMCGVAPTTATLVAAAELGATKAELVRYATSGDVTGDLKSVVAYAGFHIS